MYWPCIHKSSMKLLPVDTRSRSMQVLSGLLILMPMLIYRPFTMILGPIAFIGVHFVVIFLDFKAWVGVTGFCQRLPCTYYSSHQHTVTHTFTLAWLNSFAY